MKKYLLFLFLCFSYAEAFSQSGNLYLIFDKNEPSVIKNVYKYVRNRPNNPRMEECGVFKIGNDVYAYSYPFYYGIDLHLAQKPNLSTQIIQVSEILNLYPQARTAAQLDQDMQPHIDYDYTHPIKNRKTELFNAHTIKYLRSFDKIFVIEYLPNSTAKVVQCGIASSH